MPACKKQYSAIGAKRSDSCFRVNFGIRETLDSAWPGAFRFFEQYRGTRIKYRSTRRVTSQCESSL